MDLGGPLGNRTASSLSVRWILSGMCLSCLASGGGASGSNRGFFAGSVLMRGLMHMDVFGFVPSS